MASVLKDDLADLCHSIPIAQTFPLPFPPDLFGPSFPVPAQAQIMEKAQLSYTIISVTVD